jgi:hypothetical protein
MCNLTPFFTLAAKQAIREQALHFQSRMKNGRYDNKAYQLAVKNTTYDSERKAVMTKDDEWREESEWDDIYAQWRDFYELSGEKKNN